MDAQPARLRLAVGVSGGKDSAVLLKVLCSIADGHDGGLEILPILVDMAEGPYWSESREAADQLCWDLGLGLQVVSLKELLGASLDELVSRHPPPSRSWSACDPCTKLRNRVLKQVLDQLNVETLATGINLDDRAANFLFFSSTPQGPEVFRRGLKALHAGGGLIHLHPLITVLDEEAKVFANLNSLPVVRRDCPYAHENTVKACKRGLGVIEQSLPGFRYAFVQALASMESASREWYPCPTCGLLLAARPGEPCEGCRLMSELIEAQVEYARAPGERTQ
jgi:tRNA(Ile)-lysidine synthase TilS/MesJ